MKVVIIDDEKKARNLLRILLDENCPQIDFIEEAEGLPSGVRKIHEIKPDIVFLDVEMPKYSGIKLLDFLSADQVTFELIFTTAYSEYAINAFELNAIDYLLKPLYPEQVVLAVQKVLNKRGNSQLNKRLEELAISLQVPSFSKIAFPLAEGVLFVNLDEIIMLVAERMYTKVFTQNDGTIMISKPLRFFINKLERVDAFYQPHRSFLINLKHIKKYVTQDGGYILMDNNEMVSITKEKKKELLNLLQ